MTSEPSNQPPESQQAAVPRARRISRLAIASLVCGIVSVVGLLQGILLLFLYGHVDNYVQVVTCFMLLAAPLGLLLGIAVRLDIWTSAEESGSRRVAAWGVGLSCLPCFAIAILLVAGILFPPAFGPHSLVDCENNIRQLCAAAINYATDYNGHLPPADSWPEYLVKGGYITDHLFPCPSAYNGGRGYAMNAGLHGLRIDEIRRRSSTVLFFECAPGSPPAGGPELLPPKPRHEDFNGCFVFGFADGHAEHVSPKDLGQLNWDPKAE